MEQTMIDVESAIKARFELLEPLLNERTRRLVSAAEAGVLGRGGISIVSRLTGVSRRAITAGLSELRSPESSMPGRIRRPGGGRRRRVLEDKTLQQDLEQLINPVSKGDRTSPLRWTCTSVRKLAEELVRMGHATSHRMVADLLHDLGYRLQAKRKRVDGQGAKSRDTQLEYINQEVRNAFRVQHPVVTVDAMMKDLGDPPKGGGKPASPGDDQRPTAVSRLAERGQGLFVPTTQYNQTGIQGKGRGGVLADRDTAAFAVEVIRRWWQSMGSLVAPRAERLLVVADLEGGDELTSRLWQSALQKLADETRMVIAVYHFPQVTSRWTYIEHRLSASNIPQWRDKPIVSREVVVSLVSEPASKPELATHREPAGERLPHSIELSYEEIENLLLKAGRFHSTWNYSIEPTDNTR